MVREKIEHLLQEHTKHDYISITTRGNAAITAALSIIPNIVPKQKIQKKILIPEEGGWIHYKKAPGLLGIEVTEVKCHDAKIDFADLLQKVETKKYAAFLYQNPGGYFAEQPMKKIYDLCAKHGCTVIMDVSGSLGTALCNGDYADVLVGSFGKWKLVDAGSGGFISAKHKKIWDVLKNEVDVLEDEITLQKIWQKLQELPERIGFLQERRNKILTDLSNFNILYPADIGFVVVIEFATVQEKEKIINYCEKKELSWTECPRYIRVNKKAISIEVKQL